MTKSNKLLVIFIGFLLSFVMGAVAFAEEGEKPTVDASLTSYSQYVWRGYELSQNSLVIFPEITISYKGFGFCLWGDFDTNHEGNQPGYNNTEWWETDMVLTYGNSIGILSYTLGWIYYDVDPGATLDGVDPVTTGGDDEELFIVLGLDTFLSPEVSVWRGIEWGTSWYINCAASHSFEFENGHSLDLGVNVGWWHHPGGDHSLRGWHDLNFSAGYNVPVNDWCTVTPSINYTTTLASQMQSAMESASFDGNDHKFFYGGVTLAISF